MEVVVGVCTCKRPKMLRACLDSLSAQILPLDVAVQIVVVDNEPEPNNRVGVEVFAATCPFPVHYVHQPKRGIAAARNAILDKAMALNADQIAMLDDDETADERWIAGLMAEEYRHVAALGGRREWIFPDPKPFWADERQLRGFVEGAATTHIATHNVRISIAIPRAGHRFDETFALSGGEDFQFFTDVHKGGFEVRRTNRALTRETVHLARMSYRFEITRHYARKAWIANRERKEKGWPSMVRASPKLVGLCVVGLLEISMSPVAAIFGRRRFKQFALRGGKRLAQVAGTIAALAKHQPQPYQHIAGH